MNKYLVLLLLASFSSLVPMDHSRGKGKKRVYEIIESSVAEAAFQLTEDVWVQMNDGFKIQIPKKIGNKFATIRNFIQDGISVDEENPLELLDVSKKSAGMFLSIFDDHGELDEDSLAVASIKELLELTRVADNLAYVDQDTISDKVIERLLALDGMKQFSQGTFNFDRLLNHYGLIEKLREKIQPHIMRYSLRQEPKELRQEGFVSSVCPSSKANQILIGSHDKTARIWDIERDVVHTLSGHGSAVTAVCYSPNGNQILIGSHDGIAYVWDIKTKKVVHTLSGHEGAITSVCYSPDGNSIVTSSWDETARVWNSESGKVVLTLSGHEGAVNAVCYSPDGKQILTGSRDSARVWDSKTGDLVHELSGHEGAVISVCYSPDGKQILTGSSDGARVWDSKTGKLIHELSGHKGMVNSVCYSPDGKQILTGSSDGARVWDSKTGDLVHVLPGHKGMVNSVCYSSDGKYIVTGSSDFIARVWDSKTGDLVHELSGHEGLISRVCYSSDGKYIVTGSCDKTVLIWPVKDSELEADVFDYDVEQLLRLAYILTYPPKSRTDSNYKSYSKSVRKFIKYSINKDKERL